MNDMKQGALLDAISKMKQGDPPAAPSDHVEEMCCPKCGHCGDPADFAEPERTEAGQGSMSDMAPAGDDA